MKKKNVFYSGVLFLVIFILWTILVKFIDVCPIGPNGSSVGFAHINGSVRDLFGTNMGLYNITDWLSLIPLGLVAGFGLLGFFQLIKRKSLKKVDYSILVLGGFYIIVFSTFILFENVVINYRPILINGILEVSYPSSTTMLSTCVLPTAAMQFNSRIKNKLFRNCICTALYLFTLFMVFGRLISGVHWFSDIIGGILLSLGLILIYKTVCVK